MIHSFSSARDLQIDEGKLSNDDQANGERFFLNIDCAVQIESDFIVAGGLIRDKHGN